jgi:hypothetical protein
MNPCRGSWLRGSRGHQVVTVPRADWSGNNVLAILPEGWEWDMRTGTKWNRVTDAAGAEEAFFATIRSGECWASLQATSEEVAT